MATKTINTRIKLRVDTAANWAAHDTAAKGGVKIYKGEAALSLLSGDNAGKYEIRYGISDDGNYWSELTPNNFMVEASNVKGLLSSLYSFNVSLTIVVVLPSAIHNSRFEYVCSNTLSTSCLRKTGAVSYAGTTILTNGAYSNFTFLCSFNSSSPGKNFSIFF